MRALLLAALVLVPLAGAEGGGPRLRIALDLWAGYYPALIAEERGLFAAERVAVSIELPQDTGRMLAEFAAGTYDLVGVAMGDLVAVAGARPGVRMILVSDESAGADLVIGRAPPAADGVLRIGTRLGGFGEVLIERFRREHGIPAERLRLLQVDAADAPGLLARDEVDAVHTWQPYAGAALAAGGIAWYDSGRTPLLVCDGLIARPGLDPARTAMLAGLCRAWFAAVAWWQANPDEARALVAKRTGLSPAEISLDGIRLIGPEENRRLLTAGGLHPIADEYIRHALRRGFIATAPRPADLLDGSHLP
jgi:NitT/TauT family transport system substrate-binding protein